MWESTPRSQWHKPCNPSAWLFIILWGMVTLYRNWNGFLRNFSDCAPLLLPLPLPMVTAFSAAMVNGRMFSDEFTAEIAAAVFEVWPRSGSAAAAAAAEIPLPDAAAATPSTPVAPPGKASASTLPLPARLQTWKVFVVMSLHCFRHSGRFSRPFLPPETTNMFPLLCSSLYVQFCLETTASASAEASLEPESLLGGFLEEYLMRCKI